MNDATELFPGQAAQIAQRAREDAAYEAAAVTPLPGPLMGVFEPTLPPPEIGGLRVRPFVHYDFVLLQRLESPLLKQLQRAAASTPEDGEGTRFTDEEGYEMVYQLTRPVKEAAAVLARGREVFRQAAIEGIGMALGPLEVAELVDQVVRELVRAFSTKVKYGAASPGSGSDGTVFTAPPPRQVTGSDGGLITSAGCSAGSPDGGRSSSCASCPA
jgi:hypothetical protein